MSKLSVTYNGNTYQGYYFTTQSAHIFSALTYNGYAFALRSPGTANGNDSYGPGVTFVNPTTGVQPFTATPQGNISSWTTCRVIDSNGNDVTQSPGGNGNGGPAPYNFTGNSSTIIYSYYDPATQSTGWEGSPSGTPIITYQLQIVQSFDTVSSQDILSFNVTVNNLSNSPYNITNHSFLMGAFGFTQGYTNNGPNYTYGVTYGVDLYPKYIDFSNNSANNGGIVGFFISASKNNAQRTMILQNENSSNVNIDFSSSNPCLIMPGQSDTYTIQMRFAMPGTDIVTLAGPSPNVYDNYRVANPSNFQWQDRRMITQTFVSGSAGGYLQQTLWPKMIGLNINGTYSLDSSFNCPTLSPSVAQGMFEDLRTNILQLAVNEVNNALTQNVQGVVTWDIEGTDSLYSGGIGAYVGDLSIAYTTTPALAYVSANQPNYASGARLTVMQEYFNTYLNAGVRAGITVRSETYNWNNGLSGDPHDYNSANDPPANPYMPYTGGTLPVNIQNLITRITFAKTFGISIFYFDSAGSVSDQNVHPTWFQQVALAHPDVLICPEGGQGQVTNATYQYCAPYMEIRGGATGTNEISRYIWPNACTFLESNDGNGYSLGNNVPSYLQSVVGSNLAKGDILLIQGDSAIGDSLYAALPPTLGIARQISYTNPTATTAALSILAAYSVNNVNSESQVTYTWSCNSQEVTFSTNGSNGAKNTTATFLASGTYAISCLVTAPTSSLTESVSITMTVPVSGLNVVFDTTVYSENTNIQFFQMFSTLTYDGYNVLNNPLDGTPNDLQILNNTNHLQYRVSRYPMPPDGLGNNPYPKVLCSVTDSSGNPLSQSTSQYTGANCSPIFTYTFFDPINNANQIFSISIAVTQTHNNLKFAITMNNFGTYTILPQWAMLLPGFGFGSGYSGNGPNFFNEGGNNVTNLFPEYIGIDFTNNTLVPNAGVCCVFCSSLGLDDFKSYYLIQGSGLFICTGGAPFDSGNNSLPQYQNGQVNPGLTRSFTMEARYGVAGSTLSALAPDYIAAIGAAYPSILNWSDRRPICTLFPAGWGSYLATMYARLYGMQQNGIPTFNYQQTETFSNGSPSAWSGTANYVVTNLVSNASVNYVCIKDNTNVAPPNSQYWVVVPSIGTYNASPYSTLPYLNNQDQTANFEIFRNLLFSYAQSEVTNAKSVNAQGVIIWDVETDGPEAQASPAVIYATNGSPLTIEEVPTITSWNAQTNYVIGQYAQTYFVYICIQANNNIQPGSGANWDQYWFQLSTITDPLNGSGPTEYDGSTYVVTPNSIWTGNDFTWRNQYVGDLSQAINETPALGYVSPNPSTFSSWNSSTSYSAGTYVNFEGLNYVARINSTNVVPTTTASWFNVTLPYTGNTVLKDFFNIFLNNGLRAGCTLRPSEYISNNGYNPLQLEHDGSDGAGYPNLYSTGVYTGGSLPFPYQNLLNKINYAYENYGITIFYIDTIFNMINQYHPSFFWAMFQQINKNVLLCPEGFFYIGTSVTRCTIPYIELREGAAGSNEMGRLVYGNLCGSLIEVDNPGSTFNIVSNINNTRGILQSSVTGGDILLTAGSESNSNANPGYWVNQIYGTLPPVLAVAQVVSATTDTNQGTAQLSALGTYSVSNIQNESELTYTWSSTSGSVLFIPNGTNESKNTVATFPDSGNYTINLLIVSPTASLTISSQVSVVIQPVNNNTVNTNSVEINTLIESIGLTPASSNLGECLNCYTSCVPASYKSGALIPTYTLCNKFYDILDGKKSTIGGT